MTCLDCEHKDKNKKSKSCPNYIYCKRLKYWTNKNNLCGLVRQKQSNIAIKLKDIDPKFINIVNKHFWDLI